MEEELGLVRTTLVKSWSLGDAMFCSGTLLMCRGNEGKQGEHLFTQKPHAPMLLEPRFYIFNICTSTPAGTLHQTLHRHHHQGLGSPSFPPSSFSWELRRPFNEPPGSPLSAGRSGVNSRGQSSQDHRLHNASDC